VGFRLTLGLCPRLASPISPASRLNGTYNKNTRTPQQVICLLLSLYPYVHPRRRKECPFLYISTVSIIISSIKPLFLAITIVLYVSGEASPSPIRECPRGAGRLAAKRALYWLCTDVADQVSLRPGQASHFQISTNVCGLTIGELQSKRVHL